MSRAAKAHTPRAAARIEAYDGFDGILAELETSSVSAPFKAFMAARVKTWFSHTCRDKLAAGFTNSGPPSGDKLNVLTTLVVFASQHGMLWVPPAQMTAPEGDVTLNRLGSYTGAMAQSDNAPADVTPAADDRATARALGRCVAAAARRWSMATVSAAHENPGEQ